MPLCAKQTSDLPLNASYNPHYKYPVTDNLLFTPLK